jgi:hypothetical protein
VRAQHRQLLLKTTERGEQTIQLAGSAQLIESTTPSKYPLLNVTLDALILDQQQVGSVRIGLGADKNRQYVS